jgi:ABC-2 type transport system permease protein
MAMRWLLAKDLQILKRSPLLSALLAVYPVAIALMIGFALSSPPGKPRVAFYSQVPAGHGRISLGSQRIDIARYAGTLLHSIDAIHVDSADAAIAKVRSGQAQAALVIPGDITQQLQSLVTTGTGAPTVELYLNDRDPLERQYVDGVINARVSEVEQAVSKQVLRVAITDLQQVLDGGTIQFLGQSFHLLGLRNSRAIIQGAIASLPRSSPLVPALRQVVSFAEIAIEGLAFANPVLGSIGNPLTVNVTQLAGRTTPTESYAAAIAVIVSLMFIALLLAAGLLALERSEHAYSRLIRGLVSPAKLLSAKVLLAAGCAAAVSLVLAAIVSLFVHLQWGRFELWVLALGLGGLAFAALGVAVGAVAREINAASLFAFLVSLPVAFIALVPASAVSGALKRALDVIAFAFPFRAALDAANNAFSSSSPGILGPAVHLAVLALVFGALARLALRRFA